MGEVEEAIVRKVKYLEVDDKPKIDCMPLIVINLQVIGSSTMLVKSAFVIIDMKQQCLHFLNFFKVWNPYVK